MSFLSTIGGRILAKGAVDIARRVAREAKLKRKAYKEGYADASKGKPSKYRRWHDEV
ncbi:MAG: hypothetical protein AAFW66_03090 [Pseudomonadota bacterium]